jgi:hypothetical protein
MDIVKNRKSWAIRINNEGFYSFIGIFFGFNGANKTLPDYATGNRIALFETRAKATSALSSVRVVFPEARVVRVSVTIREINKRK